MACPSIWNKILRKLQSDHHSSIARKFPFNQNVLTMSVIVESRGMDSNNEEGTQSTGTVSEMQRLQISYLSSKVTSLRLFFPTIIHVLFNLECRLSRWREPSLNGWTLFPMRRKRWASSHFLLIL